MTLHAVARLATAGEHQAAPLFGMPGPARSEVDCGVLYGLAAQLGLDYGAQFRTVQRIELLDRDEALAYLDSSVIAEPLDRYLIHPALVDGALQALLALIADRQGELKGVSFLPWRFGRVRLAAPFGRPPRQARVRVTRLGTRSASANIALFDDAGELVDGVTKLSLLRRMIRLEGHVSPPHRDEHREQRRQARGGIGTHDADQNAQNHYVQQSFHILAVVNRADTGNQSQQES